MTSESFQCRWIAHVSLSRSAITEVLLGATRTKLWADTECVDHGQSDLGTWGISGFSCPSPQLIASVDFESNGEARYKVWLFKIKIHIRAFTGYQTFQLNMRPAVFCRFGLSTRLFKNEVESFMTNGSWSWDYNKNTKYWRLVLKS